MEKVKRSIDKVVSLACIFLLGAMAILVTYQVVVRYVFSAPSAISEVLSRYMFVWLVLIGGAYVFGLTEHMNIGIVRDHMKPKTGVIVNMVTEFCIFLFAYGIMVFGGYNKTVGQMNQLDSALQIPMGLIYMALPVSGCLIMFYSMYNEYRLAKKLVSLCRSGNAKQEN